MVVAFLKHFQVSKAVSSAPTVLHGLAELARFGRWHAAATDGQPAVPAFPDAVFCRSRRRGGGCRGWRRWVCRSNRRRPRVPPAAASSAPQSVPAAHLPHAHGPLAAAHSSAVVCGAEAAVRLVHAPPVAHVAGADDSRYTNEYLTEFNHCQLKITVIVNKKIVET